MKHIRQSSQQHASGTFDVAEDPAGLKSISYLRTVSVFPFIHRLKKLVPLCPSMNLSYLKKDSSELSGISCLGIAATPHQPLPLNVYQAPLDYDSWPEFSKDLYYLRITINGKAKRTQSILSQMTKECRELRLRIFGDTILASQNHVGLSIHQGNKTSRTVKKSSVQNEALTLPKSQRGSRGRLFQVVIYHTIQFRRAMSALTGQLSGRITFNNPTPEPFHFFRMSGCVIAPVKRAPARLTKPALLTIGVMAVPFDANT